jgi:hypothetical protein
MTDEIRDDMSVSESKINEEIIKKHDKNYHIYRRTTTVEKKGKTYNKIFKVGLYASGCVGSNIRDAVTGVYYNYKVGSKDEDRFFSVVDCTGTQSNSTITYFYQSPNHYETVNKTTVNENTHYRWNNLQTQIAN